MRPLLITALVAAIISAPVHAQSDQRAHLTAKFREKLTAIVRATDGVVGLSVIDLKSGERPLKGCGRRGDPLHCPETHMS